MNYFKQLTDNNVFLLYEVLKLIAIYNNFPFYRERQRNTIIRLAYLIFHENSFFQTKITPLLRCVSSIIIFFRTPFQGKHY